MNFLTRAYVKMQIKAAKAREAFVNDERGVAPIVATLILLLVVAIMCAIFWDQISEWFRTTMDSIFGADGLKHFDKGKSDFESK